MRSSELRDRLDKAKEKVKKCKATIRRHETQAAKKLKRIKECGWELDASLYAKPDTQDAYWAICEYNAKICDINSAQKKYMDTVRIAKNWEEKLNRQLILEEAIATEIPQPLKDAKEELVNRWVEADIKARELMKLRKEELSYDEFREFYRYAEEESLRHTDEEFYTIESRDADVWLFDLWRRVKDITGEVTDCQNIHWGGKALDGYIVGKDGICDVETIGAGGYNIQRYHLRVLVHRRN